MAKGLELFLAAARGGVQRTRTWPRARLQRLIANVRAFDLPSPGLYDATVSWLLRGFHGIVADQLAAVGRSGRVLEVGSGPGRLAVGLATRNPHSIVAGVDLSPGMVRLATRRAARAGVSERVRFQVGDVAALPFRDTLFTQVVSTLSLHHWAQPARGIAEIYRVLQTGGEARIYDLSHSLWGHALSRSQLLQLAADSPFGSVAREVRS